MKKHFLVTCCLLTAFFAFLFWCGQYLPEMQCQFFGVNYGMNATFENNTCILGNVTFHYRYGIWTREYTWVDYSWMEELAALEECGKVRC